MMRAAVEPVRHSDVEKLDAGLAELHASDPAAEVSVRESGERVIAALGELHLEQCVRELKDRCCVGGVIEGLQLPSKNGDVGRFSSTR